MLVYEVTCGHLVTYSSKLRVSDALVDVILPLVVQCP